MLRYASVFAGFMTLLAFCMPNAFHGKAGAATFYVGTCNPGKAGDYATIQAAVSSVPSGSIVDVCPGIYPEHVTINQPLTLKGIRSHDNANVVITTPAKLFGSITAQVEVNDTGGPVTISEIVVNGAGAEAGSNVSFSDSPGLLDRVSLFEALNSGVTVSGTPAVTIDQSSIQVPPSGAGISVTDETSTLTIANQLHSPAKTLQLHRDRNLCSRK